jgi:hypothetical protein
MHDAETSPNGNAYTEKPASANESDTSNDPVGDIIDRPPDELAARRAAEENARLIAEFGACGALLFAKPHCWHPLGQPSDNPVASFLSRICCWCAPAGLQLVVGIKTTNREMVLTERGRHGSGVVLMMIAPEGTGLIRPGDPGYGLPG